MSPPNIVSEYANLDYEEAVRAACRLGIAYWTEVLDGTPLLICPDNAPLVHFHLRWRPEVHVRATWHCPELGWVSELDAELPAEAAEWLNVEYPGQFQVLTTLLMNFISEDHRCRFERQIGMDC